MNVIVSFKNDTEVGYVVEGTPWVYANHLCFKQVGAGIWVTYVPLANVNDYKMERPAEHTRAQAA